MKKSSGKGKLPPKVFKKAAHLQKTEGMAKDQAIATAASMERAGRLTPKGKYTHAKTGRKAKR